uniref:DnaJ homolog subfamily C member 25 homolog n=1 Tax=Hirondellea gigas TaxID=1518452 RepID=A0A2P2HXE7_9CRUS
MMWRWILLITLALLPSINSSSVDNYYCEDDNCYDLLGITRDATKAEVKRAFRAVAGKTHPDRFQDPEEKEEAETRFKKIATAHDILRDEEVRADYDYMLDHPDEFYLNFYRAWRRRNYPNVDVRIVIAMTITLISGVQYYNGWSKFNEAIKFFSATPKYRNHALEIARQEGLINNVADKKKLKGMTKQQAKEEEERIIRKVIEDKMDIRGVYAKPTVYDLLWVQLVMFPIWMGQYGAWHVRWVYRFWWRKEEYGDEEKLYIIRKKMDISSGQFEALDDEEHQSFLDQKLWLPAPFKIWKDEKDQQIRIKQATSGRYKSYRRYLKKNGPGRMYFDDS